MITAQQLYELLKIDLIDSGNVDPIFHDNIHSVAFNFSVLSSALLSGSDLTEAFAMLEKADGTVGRARVADIVALANQSINVNAEVEALFAVQAQGRTISGGKWPDVDSGQSQSADGDMVASWDNTQNLPFGDNGDAIVVYITSDTDAAKFLSADEGDFILITDGTNYQVIKIAGANTHNESQGEDRYFWYNRAQDVIYQKGEPNPVNWNHGDGLAKLYLVKAMLDADGLNFGDALKAVLRSGLPTGTSLADTGITVATKLLLENFDDMPLGELLRWHDLHHVGVFSLTDYVFTTSGVSNAASDSGKVAMAVDNNNSGTLIIQPKNTADQNALLSAFAEGKKFTIRLSDSVYRTATSTADPVLSESDDPFKNLINVAFGNAVSVGTLTNNHAASILVPSNIPARSDLPDVVPQGLANSPINVAGAGGVEGYAWFRGSHAINGGWKPIFDIVQKNQARSRSFDSGVQSGSDESTTQNLLDLGNVSGALDAVITEETYRGGKLYRIASLADLTSLRIRVDGTVTNDPVVIRYGTTKPPSTGSVATLGTKLTEHSAGNTVALDGTITNPANGTYIWVYLDTGSSGQAMSNRRLRFDAADVTDILTEGVLGVRGRGKKVYESDDLTGTGNNENLNFRRTTFGNANGYSADNQQNIWAPDNMPEDRGVTGLLISVGTVASGTFTERATILVPWHSSSQIKFVFITTSNDQFEMDPHGGSTTWNLNNAEIKLSVSGTVYRVDIYEWHG